jgi:hypothetical protein
MAKYRLVSFKTCPWVQRVAIVLREKKIDFEFQHIEPDNRPDWFRAISPHNKVPVLRLDDRVSLFESGAIAEYSTRLPHRGCIPRTRLSDLSTAPGSSICRPSLMCRPHTHTPTQRPITTRRLHRFRPSSGNSRRHWNAKVAARFSTEFTTLWWMRPMRHSCNVISSWSGSANWATSRNSRGSRPGRTRLLSVHQRIAFHRRSTRRCIATW